MGTTVRVSLGIQDFDVRPTLTNAHPCHVYQTPPPSSEPSMRLVVVLRFYLVNGMTRRLQPTPRIRINHCESFTIFLLTPSVTLCISRHPVTFQCVLPPICWTQSIL